MNISNFDRDFNWYLRMRHLFDFDGVENYYNKKGIEIVQYSRDGVSGRKAFYLWDSQGKIVATKHPNIFRTLLKVKGSCNLHIKMYAEDRASGNFGFTEFRGLCFKFRAPDWFREAVEKQKVKYYKLMNYE